MAYVLMAYTLMAYVVMAYVGAAPLEGLGNPLRASTDAVGVR